MITEELRSQEVSIWTLQDEFITVLKWSDVEQKGRIENPRMTLDVDGTRNFTFSIPMYFYDNGTLVENPNWYNTKNKNLQVNMRKIKVIFRKTQDEEKLFAQVNYFMPPIMLVFFVRGGMSLDFSVFAQSSTLTAVPFIVIVLAFLVVRFAGKYGGAYLGGVVTAQSKETRNYLGFGLIPQASVAIALATMAANVLEANGHGEHATALLAIVLASSIIF